jgi:glutamate-1-semialdehyde 2,1-aminomutase
VSASPSVNNMKFDLMNPRDALVQAQTYIPGAVSSTNRIIQPAIAFTKARGAYLWDLDGTRYVDYHAAFAPYLLGHNCEAINQAVIDVLQSQLSLFGAGPGLLEGQLAQLISSHVSPAQKLTFLNTGSEATSLALRLSRTITSKPHFIVMQGGYNGNQDELACNVFNSLNEIGPRVSPGEYAVRPLGAGTVVEQSRFAHPINFNDLDSVDYVCRRYPVAALITEPVLQNIGVVRPQPNYLRGLRALADQYGFLLIFDEVKTGFRHGLGGYSAICGVTPDLVVYGKAVANGFPLAALGGKREHMDCIVHPDASRRPLVAGTYNGHPVAVTAALRTVQFLIDNEKEVYETLEAHGERLAQGMRAVFSRHGVTATVARQGSALSFYFMDALPRDFHHILEHHKFEQDLALRRALLSRGVFVVPVATKQLSISYAHTSEDIDFTIEQFDDAVAELRARKELQ